jgi:hypothetical protein
VTDLQEAPPVLSARPRWDRVGVVLPVATVVVGLPLLVAVVALVRHHWYPVLDLAMTEFRVRDVFTSHTPLIGLPGRIGTYPNQGSHPGPLSFYFLAPTYRLLGETSWSLEVGTVVVHLAAVVTGLWIGWRRAGWRGVTVVAALLALAIRGYGQVVLTQPWNPYLPLIPWIVVLLATWAVLCGDHVMLIPLTVFAILCAQTHVPYLPLAVGLVALALGTVVVRVVRAPAEARRRPLRSVAWAAGVGVVLWLPPVADQLTNRPGNMRQLIEHFGSPPEPAIGLGDGVRLALQHLDVWAGLGGQLAGTGRFVSTASTARGLVVFVAWLAAAVVAFRVGSGALRALHVVVAAALVLGVASMARIFGRPWFYLTLWAWGVTTLLVGAVVWSAVAWWQRRRPDTADRLATRVALVAAGVAVVTSVATAVAFADAHPPEQRLSNAVGALAAPTYRAVVDGIGAATGKDGRYIVRWSDAADIGSPGFGLLDELERRGLDVAADEYFHVPVTEHRVRPRAQADAQIHFATGSYIDAWRAQPGAVEVATFDARTPAQRDQFATVRSRLIDRLAAEDAPDLVPLVDTNLFGMSVDPRLSAADQADLTTMIDLGQPMAVFIAPPPSDDDPNAL